MPVSKTDFIRGLQCEKMLWLDSHAPELKIIPPEVQARLDAGNEFGDKAMSLFGAFVETTVLREDGRLHFAAMLEKTRELLTAGEYVVCEGAFSWYGNFCAADILKKDGAGYAIYEVKNTPYIRKEFLLDLAFQRLIIQNCGVKLSKSFLILNGKTPNPQESTGEQNAKNSPRESASTGETPNGDFLKCAGQVRAEFIEKDGEIYKIVDVSLELPVYEKVVRDKIFPLGKIKKKDAPIPSVTIGEHCYSPYPCWYLAHCQAQKK